MEKKFVSVVAYMHNSEKDVAAFFENVIPIIRDKFEKFEIVCVDDACNDNTVEIVRRYVKDHSLENSVSLLKMGFYQGLETSMNAGRDVSIGDFVYEFDTLSVDYPIDLITELYDKLLEGFDIVSAGPNKARKWTSRVFYRLYNLSKRGNGMIESEYIRLLSRRAVNRIKSNSTYIPYRKAVYANSGLNRTKIIYKPLKGAVIDSEETFYKRSSLALDAFIYFTNIMERVSAIVCCLFLVISIGMIIYSIVDYFTASKIAEGWASTMCFMSLGFFGVFALLTIVLKYMSVMINLVFRQHKYLISDIEKL